MTNYQDELNRLKEQLDLLLKRQQEFSGEIQELQENMKSLMAAEAEPAEKKEPSATDTDTAFEPVPEKEKTETIHHPGKPLHEKEFSKPAVSKFPVFPRIKSDFEKFIGENLINKIGITILVIGVGIGAKYSIDHDLISPLTRIILGYGAGLVLLVLGMKLKEKYSRFSAVLVSGAMAVMYVITYAAYSFYGLFPQPVAFGLMVLFTGFTVTAALHYNMQAIGHIALVGAYAVPFLLSDGSENAGVLFSYMAIVNTGILTIAVKRYWKPLYVVSFLLTWLIVVFWYALEYRMAAHFGTAIVFFPIFFVIFYGTFLSYKLRTGKKFNAGDVSLLLANAFIFYGLGYDILDGHQTGAHLLGLFTLMNAALHFIAGIAINRRKSADRSLFYFVVGLTLVFVTITMPVQLDGSWVTLLWAGEAALLFWIGRTKGIPIYEKMSWPLMFLAFFSLAQDWVRVYQFLPDTHTPLFNVYFLTSLLFVAVFGFIQFLHQNPNYPSLVKTTGGFIAKIISFSIPAILLISLYFAFQLEIDAAWNQMFEQSRLSVTGDSVYLNYDLLHYKYIWSLNYSLLFFAVLALVNNAKIKNRMFGFVNLGFLVLVILVFVTQGLYELSELRTSYLEQSLGEYYHRGVFNVTVRYCSYVLVALALWAFHRTINQDFMQVNLNVAFDFLLHGTVLWIAGSELIHWMELAGAEQTNKLGLSILWGTYALFLIVLGIWKKKKHLRIGAIILFGCTLIKLFFYDISHLDTIAKIVVFISLGILLLIISFLYNKYKHIISDEDKSETPD